MIKIMRNKSTSFIPSFIVVVLQFLIENIKSLTLPRSESICHIYAFDRDISLGYKKYTIRNNIPNRVQNNRRKSWRSSSIRLSPHTPPESLRTNNYNSSVSFEHLYDLICHFFSYNMLKWLYIDMSRRIDEDILLVLHGRFNP